MSYFILNLTFSWFRSIKSPKTKDQRAKAMLVAESIKSPTAREKRVKMAKINPDLLTYYPK